MSLIQSNLHACDPLSAQPWISFENPSHSIQLDDFNLYKQYLNDRKSLLLSKADVKKLYLFWAHVKYSPKCKDVFNRHVVEGLFSPLCNYDQGFVLKAMGKFCCQRYCQKRVNPSRN